MSSILCLTYIADENSSKKTIFLSHKYMNDRMVYLIVMLWCQLFCLCPLQLMKTTRGVVWRQGHVDTAAFYTNKEVDHIITEVEVWSTWHMVLYHVVAFYMEHWAHYTPTNIVLFKLSPRGYTGISWWSIGWLVGWSIAFFVWDITLKRQ